MRWILLLQEYGLWIMDRKGTENQITDHLSKIENHLQEEELEDIKETFVDEQLFRVDINQSRPDYVNYITRGIFPAQASWQQKKRIAHE
ncbi:Retrovirus-related Pol polyprotein from transposon 17.6 [Gossypium australe]|uniref:Retrovirus-related Pol polyprotein from transposon 17.6 n=1 Tax=Gossypium australe TaxID=47621 RepID=A0A5B6VKH6_9ROSI|nr:Retrovirus-related Pol polyprotein from transposon 17.6 [Gossypium australe]